jgi:hypothetical protein
LLMQVFCAFFVLPTPSEDCMMNLANGTFRNMCELYCACTTVLWSLEVGLLVVGTRGASI